MTILSERLLVRSYTEADADDLAAILGDPITMQFWPQPLSRAASDAWLERAIRMREDSCYGRRTVILRATGALIGDVGVVRAQIDGVERDDLGYIIHHPYQRRGYALEAARALQTCLFAARRVPALFANMAHDHSGSQRVAEKLGMRRIGSFNNPRNRDLLTYLYRIEAAMPMDGAKSLNP